jgi:peptidoglycan/LPS O-acetylase OafA/YrhL
MPKLYTLDAMRGVAALMVAALHFGLLRSATSSPYLAVDFFFALSGFVIAYSYDRRLSAGMTDEEFITRRLIRLYPLFALGLCLGLVVTLAGQVYGSFGNNNGPALVQLLTALVFIPFPSDLALNGTEGSVAPLNGPYWSLILEIHMNVVFAIFFRWLGMGLLTILVTLLGFGIVATAWSEATLETGYLTHTFHFGIVRVGFSFLAGVLICRLRHRLRVPKLHWAAVLMLVAGLLALPTPESIRWIYDSVCVLVLFPMLILAGAQSQPRGAKLTTAFAWIGGASYALYALHYPMVMVAEAVAEANAQLPFRVWSVAFLMLTIALAFAADRLFDIPVRRWLNARYKQPEKPKLKAALAKS